jgi:hypothetical protein
MRGIEHEPAAEPHRVGGIHPTPEASQDMSQQKAVRPSEIPDAAAWSNTGQSTALPSDNRLLDFFRTEWQS